MAQITLVRHGQANSHSHDEESYDKLSDLGHQQAKWLGEHMRETDQEFDSVYCGTLRRHIETAQGMNAEGYAPIIKDARLNELAYFDLSNAYQAFSGSPTPTNRDDFLDYMPKLLNAWRDGKLDNIPESFQAFEARVTAAISDIAEKSDRALVVTSGGLISMVTRQVMDLNMTAFGHVCLGIMNTSVHRMVTIGGELGLAQFNNVAHLEKLGRHEAQTYI